MLVIEHQIRIYIIIKNNYIMIMLIILINSMIMNVHPHLLYHTQPIDSHIMLYDSIGCIMLYPWFRAGIPNPENLLSGCLRYIPMEHHLHFFPGKNRQKHMFLWAIYSIAMLNNHPG